MSILYSWEKLSTVLVPREAHASTSRLWSQADNRGERVGNARGTDTRHLPGVSPSWFYQPVASCPFAKETSTFCALLLVQVTRFSVNFRWRWREYNGMNSAWTCSVQHRNSMLRCGGQKWWGNRPMRGQVLHALKLCYGKSAPWGSFSRKPTLTACLQQPRNSSKSHWSCWQAWEKVLNCLSQNWDFLKLFF